MLRTQGGIRGDTYLIYGEDGKLDIRPNTPDYFSWLTNLSSFHFKGANGHFTARQEVKKQGSTTGYWYAYRKAGKNQFKKYLGATNKLTTAHLEATAARIQDEITNLPVPEKKPRKKPTPKATLRNQIAMLEKTVAEQKNHIQALEQENEALKIQKATEGHRRFIKNRKRE